MSSLTLVAGLEHRRVGSELVAVQAVVPRELRIGVLSADQGRDLGREGDVRELAVVRGELGRDADLLGVGDHGVKVLRHCCRDCYPNYWPDYLVCWGSGKNARWLYEGAAEHLKRTLSEWCRSELNEAVARVMGSEAARPVSRQR